MTKYPYMKLSFLCPVSDQQINAPVARFNALFTLLILLLFFYIHNLFLIVFLAIDFALRANDMSEYSPLALLSRFIVKSFGIKPKMQNAGPKLFAAKIGYFLCILIIVLGIFRLYTAALVSAGILGLFSFLEAAFGFCMACYIYPHVYKLTYKEPFKE